MKRISRGRAWGGGKVEGVWGTEGKERPFRPPAGYRGGAPVGSGAKPKSTSNFALRITLGNTHRPCCSSYIITFVKAFVKCTIWTRYSVPTRNDTRRYSAISGTPVLERTDFGPAVCSQTDPTMPQPAALWTSPRNVLRQRLIIFQ